MLYSDIINSVLSYSDRQDSEVLNALPMMMNNVVEPMINRYLFIKKTSGRATTNAQGLGVYYYDLPSDFLEVRDIKVWTANTDPTIPASILYVPTMSSPEQIDGSINNNMNQHYAYSIEGTQFRMWPAIVTPAYIEILYYRMVPPINATSPSNWLSTYYPDVYLFGLIA